MHAKAFLHKLLRSTIHESRIKLLTCIVDAVIKTKKLKLTALGRALDPSIQERSGIRKVDRLLGNKFFQEKSAEVYREIIKICIGNKTRPILIVDWTKLPNVNEYALRVALAVEGRALTLYEEVHPKKQEGTSRVHKQFLKRLKSLLPLGCKPIVITDAGFKNPWFREVLKQGWDYIGRVRGLTKYDDGKGYKPCSDLHRKGTRKAQFLGEKRLSKKGSVLTHFYIVKEKLKGRKKYTKNGKRAKDKDSKNYSRSYREPWLLVSSMNISAEKIVKRYKQRMTIEEGFRDLKSSQYGFSLEENKTMKRKRLVVWLLIANLASMLAWVVGYKAEQMRLHYQFQSNTIRNRRVLSFFYLGCQIIRKKKGIPINLGFLCVLGEET